MLVNPCPAQEQLQRLLAEELPPPERSTLEAHVEQCRQCQQTLDQLVEDPQLLPSAPVDSSAHTPLLGLRRPPAEAAEPRPEDLGRTANIAALAEDKPLSIGFLTPPARPDSLGRLGHYEVLEVLGRGGFGIVFRAFDEVLQRIVAVKVLAPELAATSPARKRFLRETWAAAQVRHENVVQIYAVEEHPLPYLVMEFIPGETLQQRLDRAGPFDAAEVVAIGRQIADGLAAAHAAGLIHRDVKPANVLLEQGPRLRAKITDFGLARAADDASLTQSGVVAGTPLYMSPEQARGETLDPRTDLFSLGSVLYAITSGRPPFRAENPLAVLKRVTEDTPRPISEIIPETPAWLCRVIAQLMAKDPAARYQTAQALADDLAGGKAPAEAPRPPSWQLAIAVLLACLAVLGSGVAALTQFGPWRDGTEPTVHAPEASIRSSPMDALDRRTIPSPLLDPLGGAQAPPEVVAVLGDRLRFVFPSDSRERFAPHMSADGTLIAAPSGLDGNVEVFEVPAGRLLRTLPGPGGQYAGRRIRELAISADGRLLAGVTWGFPASRLRIWDLKTFEVLYTTPPDAQTEDMAPLAYSPDGRWLVVGLLKPEGVSRVCEARTGKEVRMLTGPPWGTFSSDGKLYAASSEDLDVTLRVWETDTWRVLKTWTREMGTWKRARFSPDDKLLIGGSSNRLDVWKTDTWESVGSFAADCPYPNFLSDGKTVLSDPTKSDLHGSDGRVHPYTRWDVTTGQKVGEFQVEGPPGPVLVSVSPDRRSLVLAHHFTGPSVRIFDTETGRERYVPKGNEGPVHGVAFSPDGRTLASGDQNGTVRLWDTAAGRLQRTLTGHQGAVSGVAFHPDGTTLASGGADGTVRLWDLATDQARTFEGHAKGRPSLTFSPDGKALAVASAGGVRVLDTASGALLRELPTRAEAGSVAFSADGKWLAAGCTLGILGLWETATGRELSAPRLNRQDPVLSIAFHPTTALLAVGTQHPEGDIGVWALEPPRQVQRLEGHRSLVRFSAWGPGGQQLVSVGWKDGMVLVWDPASPTPRGRAIRLGTTEILGAALSPEGRYLATANADGTIYLLRLAQAGEALRVP